jgi:outer membrane usher protein FimD/PapC
MRKNKVKPYVSGSGSKSSYDVNYGVSVSKGNLSVDVSQSRGSGYSPETTVNVGLSVPITKRMKKKIKL